MVRFWNQVLKEKEVVENKEIIRYAIIQLRDYILGILVTIFIGYKMGIVFQSLAFLLFFIPLRIYAGGYHASSRIRCAIISIILLILSFLFIKSKVVPENISIWLGQIEGAILYFLIPVNGKYSMEMIERIVYRERGRKIILLEMVMLCLLKIMGFESFVITIISSFSTILLLIIIQKVNDMR